MSNISNFIYMGGYALYIWPSFGITFLLMIFLIIKSSAEKKNNIAKLRDLKTELDKKGE